MAAVLRVKRKKSFSPLDALVIACKRQKTEATDVITDPVETVVEFHATVTDPNEDVTKYVTKFLDPEDSCVVGDKRRFSQFCNPSGNSKRVKWVDVDAVEKHKVTDCQPSLDKSNENEKELRDKWMTIIDVKDSWSASHPEHSEEKEDTEDYVYDLYCAQTSDNVWFASDSRLMLRQPDYSIADDVPLEDDDHDSTDSNAESYWKNDYPDTESDNSSADDYFDRFRDKNSTKTRKKIDYFDDYSDEEKEISVWDYRKYAKCDMNNSSDSDDSSDSESTSSSDDDSCDKCISDDVMPSFCEISLNESADEDDDTSDDEAKNT